MNIDITQKFIEQHTEQILKIFETYQKIEILFFMNLYLPKKLSIEELNKLLNTKTCGMIEKEYLRTFPDDKYGLKKLLRTVTQQRNSFMHSFWIFLALTEKKNLRINNELILNDFQKNADELLNIIIRFNEKIESKK